MSFKKSNAILTIFSGDGYVKYLSINFLANIEPRFFCRLFHSCWGWQAQVLPLVKNHNHFDDVTPDTFFQDWLHELKKIVFAK